MDYLTNFFANGSFIMYLILLCLSITLIIISERVYFLFFVCKLKADMFINKIYEFIKSGNYLDALIYCEQYSAPLSKIVKSALENHGGQFREIQNAVDEGFLENYPKINKNISLLPNLAYIATLLGLLGTLIGIADAFGISNLGIVDKFEHFSNGFALSLNSTVFGIIVAIIAMIGYTIFTHKSENIIKEIDENSVKLINYIVHRRGQ